MSGCRLLHLVTWKCTMLCVIWGISLGIFCSKTKVTQLGYSRYRWSWLGKKSCKSKAQTGETVCHNKNLSLFTSGYPQLTFWCTTSEIPCRGTREVPATESERRIAQRVHKRAEFLPVTRNTLSKFLGSENHQQQTAKP